MQIGVLILFFLAAATKFMIAPPIGLTAGWNYWEVVAVEAAGGITGVLGFYHGAHALMEWSRKRFAKKRSKDLATGKEPPRIFNKTSRKLVRWKHKLGYYGIVFIALPFVSLPIEGIICAKFFKHERMLIPFLILSVIIWAFILTAFYAFFYEKIRALIL